MQKATSSSYQTIVVTILGPTNTKGSRIKASCDAGSVILAWDHSLGTGPNGNAAVKALLAKVDWHGNWVGGNVGAKVVYVCA